MSALVLFAKDIDRLAAFYGAVLDAPEVMRDAHHVVLDHSGTELIVHGVSATAAQQIDVEQPPRPRTQAAFKPAFDVDDLDRVRRQAAEHGGMLYPARRGFLIRGRHCIDGVDAEGNVVQFRQTMPPPEPVTAGRSAATRSR